MAVRASGHVMIAGIAVALALSWWVTGLEGFSASATRAVLVSGAVAMVAGRARRVRRGDGTAFVALLPWLGLVVGLATWQLVAYFGEPRSEHPTLSSLTNTALDPRPLRAVAFVGWLGGAWWLARR